MVARRLLVAVNKNASRCEEALGPALAVLGCGGLSFDLRQPESREAMAELIRGEGARVDGIVVCGGDGTVNGAVSAVIDAGRPLGILPLGTANDLALTLGIPAEPAAAAQIVVDGARRRIDVGRANGIPFLNVASIGLSVQVAERQDAQRKQHWRVLSYVLSTIEVLGEADRFRATLTCDGHEREVDAYQIAVGNGVHYGGGMTVSEDARIDDGLLDVYAIETRSIADLVALGPAIRAGTHGRSEDVTVLRCRDLTVTTRRPMPVNTDGEVTTETPARFTTERRALEVFAPAPGA